MATIDWTTDTLGGNTNAIAVDESNSKVLVVGENDPNVALLDLSDGSVSDSVNNGGGKLYNYAGYHPGANLFPVAGNFSSAFSAAIDPSDLSETFNDSADFSYAVGARSETDLGVWGNVDNSDLVGQSLSDGTDQFTTALAFRPRLGHGDFDAGTNRVAVVANDVDEFLAVVDPSDGTLDFEVNLVSIATSSLNSVDDVVAVNGTNYVLLEDGSSNAAVMAVDDTGSLIYQVTVAGIGAGHIGYDPIREYLVIYENDTLHRINASDGSDVDNIAVGLGGTNPNGLEVVTSFPNVRYIVAERDGGVRSINTEEAVEFDVSGTVTDTTGSGIESATVDFQDGSSFQATTDASGDYTVTVGSDTYTVTASASGFYDQVTSQTVDSEVTGLDFTLLTDYSGVVSGPLADENRQQASLTMVDDNGNPIGVATESAVQQLIRQLPSIGSLQDLADAVQSRGTELLRSAVFDSSDTRIDPAVKGRQPITQDVNIDTYDLVGSGDYTTSELSVQGTSQIVIKVASDDSETFSVTVDWTDGNGTVLYSQEPAEADSTTDALLVFNTGSAYVQVTITDDSGAGQNQISGTINVH